MSNDELTTTPTIETLLARLDEWGSRFTNELAEIRAGQDELRSAAAELQRNVGDLQHNVEDLRKGQEDLRKGQEDLRKGQEDLRNDLNGGLRRIERKIQILNDNLLTIKADIRDMEVRLEKLESESLTKG